ncbi:hypothetical protein C8D70_102285 [Chryseobacterium sp. CBTAP 102]|nr:hypothetical protein C8D70_102285 [Chryseobacterium sp. CBTAP 102]
MRNLCRKHAVKQNLLKKWTAVKIILQKKTATMIKQNHVMMTAARHVLPVTRLLKPLSQKIYVWNFLITNQIRILSFSMQILIFQTV